VATFLTAGLNRVPSNKALNLRCNEQCKLG
jgi:hypothetical protein